jgi:hypothetical protein
MLNVRSGLLVATALLLAIPAFLLVNGAFDPRDNEFRLEGRDGTHTFRLDRPEPLEIEHALTLRAPAGERPTVRIDVNGTTAIIIEGGRLFAPQTGKRLLPLGSLRSGENTLRVWIDGSPSASFDFRAHLRNYAGIAPDFPRMFIVFDATVAERTRSVGLTSRVLTFAACAAASFILVGAIALVTRNRRSPRLRIAMLVAPSVLLWVAVVYSAMQPIHVWLSIEAVAVVAVVGLLLMAVAIWAGTHRTTILRAAAVTVVTLISLEVALRLYHYVRPTFVFYTDGYSRYRGGPNAPFFDSRLNSRGFNDVEHALDRPSDVRFRVVAIGDSATMGVVPYAHNYLTLLEAELRDIGPVEIVNMGVSATTPRDYVDILVNEGLAFGPDLVLANVFIGNDFETPGRKPWEYSYVATFVRFLSRFWNAQVPSTAAAAGTAAAYEDAAPSFSRERFLEIEVDRAVIYGDDLAPAVERVASRLAEMRDIAARAGAGFAVVFIPDEVQVDPALQSEVAQATGRAPDALDFGRPNRLLAAALAAQGIVAVDLLPAFQRDGSTTRLYKPQDTHWNIAGNRLAASTLAPFLRDRLNDASVR